MKIVLLLRSLMAFLLVSFISVMSTSLNAQCTGCAESAQSLTECGSDFDLTEVTIGAPNSAKYYETCTTGTLGSEITGANITSYSSTSPTNTIYVEELDNMDACQQIIEVTLNYTPNLTSAGTSYATTDAACPDSDNGTLVITNPPTTTTSHYTVGSGTVSESGGVITISGLDSDDSPFTVVYSNSGCAENSSPQGLAAGDPVNAVISPKEPITCNNGMDGEVNVSASGGSGSYVFTLFKNGTTTGMTTSGASGFFTTLAFGTYTVLAVDAASSACSNTSSSFVTLINPPNYFNGLTIDDNDASCVGAADGSIKINNPASTNVAHYSISPNVGNIVKVGNDIEINNLPGDTYTIIYIPCGDPVVVVVDAGAGISITSATPTPITCFGGTDGTIIVSVTGGTGNYIYRADKIGTNNDPSDITSSNSPQTFMNLGFGDYIISVESANSGCTDIFVPAVELANPAEINFTATKTTDACAGANNGSITVSGFANATTLPYIIKVNGSTHGTSSGSSYLIPGLDDGNYSITVEDSSNPNCTTSPQVVNVGALPALNPSITGDLILCSTVSMTLLTVGENYTTYAWSNGDDTKQISVGPGTYTVTVTENGCMGSETVTVAQLPALTASLITNSSETGVSCAGVCDGNINVSVAGGNGNYTFAWTGPNSYSNSNQNIAGLCAGNYNLVVSDTEGCNTSLAVEITAPPSVMISSNPSPATCFGFSDGSITSNPIGGTPDYNYAWSGPNSYTNSTKDISSLLAGAYTVVVTDDNGCTDSSTATVNEPDAVPASISPASDAICLEKSTSLTASGGTGYLWNNGEGANALITVSPTTSTTYIVTVTDATGCTASASTSVTVNPLPEPSISVTESSGLSGTDRRICEDDVVTLTASGASSLIWGGGKANPLMESPSNSTTYEVLATDNNGCTAMAQVNIEVDDNPNAVIINKAQGIDGDVQNLENSSTTQCGGSTFLSCEWLVDGTQISTDCGNIAPVISGSGEKLIELIVINQCGCEDTDNTTIDIVSANDCQVKEFSINGGSPVACVDVFVPYVQENQTSNGGTCAFEVQPNLKVFKNNIDVTTITSIVTITGDMIRFREEGDYVLQNIFSDMCGCSKDPVRSIKVIPAPDAGFAPGNPTKVCEDGSYTINLSGYDEGETVNIVGVTSSGNQTYQSGSFIFTPESAGTTELRITEVTNGVCEASISGEVLNIEVIPDFKLMSANGQDGCNEDGDLYDLTIITEGGDPGAQMALLETGFTTKLLGDNGFIIQNLNPLLTYDFTLMKGDVCDPISIPAPMITCACGIRMAPKPDVNFAMCEGDDFTIEGIFNPLSGDSDFDPEMDTFVYVIHNSGAIGKSGTVFAVFPADTKSISSGFPNFVLGSEFYLSPVGIKKAVLERFDFENPNTLSNLGESDCFSLVQGIRMIWYRNPTPVIKTKMNIDQICKNEFNFMVYVDNLLDGSDVDISIDGLSDEFVEQFGSQDTGYVYFQNTGQDSFVIRVRERQDHFDNILNRNITCETVVTKTVYVKEGIGSPALSEIILWPGNIFASTADSLTTCYEWGYFNQGTIRRNLGSGKYYYAPTDIDFGETNRKYFVDTYNCDDPSCVTRVFYNNDGPPPGLQIKDLQNFSYVVAPNPSDGQFNLEVYGKYESDVEIQIIDLTGKQISQRKAFLTQGKNVLEFDLYDAARGIYFLKIHDKSNNQYSIEKIVIN